MKKIVLLGVILIASAPRSWANICAHDATPAASLLFPFVVYDFTPEPSMYTNPPVDRTNSIVTITNISANAQVLKVVVWTDFGIPILDFNVILTGYDVLTFSMRDIWMMGQLPVTLSSPHSGTEGTASNGPVSEGNPLNGAWLSGLLPDPQATNTLGDRCSPSDPHYPGNYTMPIPGGILNLFKSWLTSSQTALRSHTDDCEPPYSGGSAVSTWFEERDTDDEAWMYLTVDVVESCNAVFPDSPGYWVPGSSGGQARYDNVLLGEIVWAFPPFMHASAPAVHLEADQDLAAVVPQNGMGYPSSFYARYANPNDQISDLREPLPTAWALRYRDYGVAGMTSVLAWKGSTEFHTPMDMEFYPHNEDPDSMIASSCHPYTYYVWDDEENVIAAAAEVDPNLLPLATQEVPIDQLETVDSEGWMLFVFPPSNYSGDGAPAPPDSYQTWMGAFYSSGPSKAFLAGNPMANANCWDDQVLPELGVGYDYVDPSGYVSGAPTPPKKSR